MNSWIDFSAVGKIIVVGLLAGAGLPALFSVGIRALALPGGGRHGTDAAAGTTVMGGNTVGLVLAVLCFATVLAGIGLGIYIIVAA
ncbi:MULTISPECIES: hypothetical protein [unclassified Frankia]|uniref:hypothetical protein n=1 Tax=unclassified Frankia TaxID=2632575 RepID=UPI002AD343EA|nr:MULTISPECIES: hypothetical protein [unclassified Frankia]